MPQTPCKSPISAMGLLFMAMTSSLLSAEEASFNKILQPYLDHYCTDCHNAEKHKGDFRLDTLSREIGFKDTPHWAEVMERINSGEMPPKKQKNRPTAEQSATIVGWISARIKEGESVRMARRDRVSYNRLTRDEYVNTLRDLVGVEYDATDPGGLLEDPEWNGFERIGSVLTLSPTHIEKYIKAAEIVLDEAYPDRKIEYVEAGKRADTISPESNPDHYERLAKMGLQDKVRQLVWAGDVFRGSNPFNGRGVKFPGPGIYEFSYTLSGLKAEGKPAPRFQVYAENLDRVLFEQDVIAPEDKPTTVTFQAHFPSDHFPTIHVINKLDGLNPTHRSARHGRRPFVSLAEGRLPWQMKLMSDDGEPLHSFLILTSITVRGPILSDQEKHWRQAYMPTESGDIDQIRTGLAAMAQRAFRRPLYPGELDSFIHIAQSEMAAGASDKNAVKSAMTAILCSKSFLFISEGDEDKNRHTLNDWELASRLSYLLWSTMPDSELLALAEQGKLRDKGELEKQFVRMIKDPRAKRFSDSFSSQWLHLRNVGKFPPDRKIYSDYDDHLEKSMVGETQAYFKEVLDRDLTLRAFLDSDWTMVNPRLAQFYGIPNITQDVFQRVAVNADHQRGGLLTHASVLSLTSDGTRHRPVHRGAWLSEAILGKTPPPPPANVDPIEPNPVNEPKATLRMKLDAHKHDPRCAACHQKIDPLGFAFDNFNAIGAWQTHEVVSGTGDNPPVDASGEMPDGRTFKNAKEFKQLLLADLDTFNHTFIEKLAVYGLRRTTTIDDRDDIQAIAKVGKENDYRVKDIVKAFVLSDLFQKR